MYNVTTDGHRWSRLFMAIIAAICVTAFVASDASAQRGRDRDEREEGDENRVFSAKVGEIVLRAQEAMTAEDNVLATQELNTALAERNVSPYELGIILHMRGALKYGDDDLDGALADWTRSLAEGDHKFAERLSLMYNVAQLHLVNENYRVAIQQLEEWIVLGGEATDKVHLNLVAAYVETNDYRNALRHARLAYQKAEPREKRHYDTLNYLYAELNMPIERAELLSEMVELFPEERAIWLSIAALHAEGGRLRKAFEINKIVYLNGMYTEEREIMRVIDYYSYYEVPFRGAVILEREMNRGRIARTRDNYEKLGRLYRQANEFARAIPALEAAASMAPSGEAYRTLGEAHYAEGQLQQAERALVRALNRGGLDDAGDAWVVLGNVRYERGNRETAIEAFEEGERFQGSRSTARDWREFVLNEIAAEERRVRFGIDTKKEESRVSCRRQLADIVLYQTRVASGDYDGPDCIAIVREEDFTSVPEIGEMEANFDRRFRDVDVAEGDDSEAEAEDASSDSDEAPADEAESEAGQ